jgi:hypothetical protein
VGSAHAGDLGSVLTDFQDYFDYIINVALGVDAAGDGEADQVHRRCGGGRCWFEHQGANFYGADSDFEIAFGGERTPGNWSGGICGRKARASR